MSLFGRAGAGAKGTLQLVQRGTDKLIPVEFIKDPSGEVLDPALFENLIVSVTNERSALCATPPVSISGNTLIIEMTADVTRHLGLGVCVMTAKGRIPDEAYHDGYHDYEIVVPLCNVTRYGSNETPVKVTANVLEGLRGKDGKSAYQSYLDTTDDNPKLTEKEWADTIGSFAKLIKAVVYGTEEQ